MADVGAIGQGLAHLDEDIARAATRMSADGQAQLGTAPGVQTMQNGLEELRKAKLLRVRTEWVTAELSGIGRTKKNYYSLEAPFGTEDRKRLQETARAAAKRRQAETERKARPRRVEAAPRASTPTTDPS